MGIPSRKIKLSLFLRRPSPGDNYSIERLFDAVIAALPADRYEVRLRVCPLENKGLLRRLALIIWAACRQGDVNHVTGDVNFLGLLMRRSRTLLTITDSASMQRLVGWRRWLYRAVWLRLPIWRAGCVTVISETTLHETLSYVRSDPAKFSVIPCCVPRGMLAEPRPFPDSRPRILAVGTKPNKNLPRIIEALVGVPCQLVVVGALTELQQELLVRHDVEIENHVHLDDAAMALQYRKADVVVFVSTYEGFGLPIIEGQAVGRPVITSRRAPMQEVAGAGAFLVDPESVGEIREAVLRIIQDSQYRATLVQAGFENVRAYSPEIIARQYASVYEALFSGTALSSEETLERLGKKSARTANRELTSHTFDQTQPYLNDLASNVAGPGSVPYGSDMGEINNDPACGENRYGVIYLTNYVGPQVRAARNITTDSAAGSKKSVDLVHAMETVGVKVVFLSLGWKRATWSLRAYLSMTESVDGRLVCEYAGQRDFPLLNFITNIASMCRLVAEKVAEEQAIGFSCRLIVYNPSVQMILVALYARLLVRLPIYLQLEDGTHLIPTVGIFRRAAYFVSHQVFRRLINGVILVSPVIRRGYETVPSVICRGLAMPDLVFPGRSRLDDPAIASGGGAVTFFFGSTLDEIRGVVLLLDALKRADADSSFPAGRAKFIITGKGSIESKVAEHCRSFKRLRAEFMGFVDLATYQRLLSEAHVAMALQDPSHPYSRACFPSKVIEYMTSGALVLTTAVADIVEFTDGMAVLVDPLLPQTLVEIWKDIINHPMPYAQIAAAGQALVLEKCSLERTGLAITSLFK